ncbi:DUF6668 family protein [Streptomyces sp. NPDC001744]|uniref:DUF6668 family protein n=1 Tax=Streptomyces sp. NPDC001744 TaxID=3364606 RepID=UPI00369A0B3E
MPAPSGPVPGAAVPPGAGGRFSWMGAHGGAGTSTLAQVFGGHDSGLSWPDAAAGRPGNVLLVARTHASGLQAVSRILNAHRQNEIPAGVTLAAVVLVADAPGRLPRELNQRIKVIGSVVEVHRVPWVSSWRTGNLSGPLPREVAALGRLVAGN